MNVRCKNTWMLNGFCRIVALTKDSAIAQFVEMFPGDEITACYKVS